ncbi:MAG: ABC transporter ATP-binding protein [Desulfotomaculaceae bacterium]|nr:ABC transporter ATP-binding protein [Desulfotomaculaceae bacterium]
MIAFEHVHKTLGQTRVLHNFSLPAKKNEITCIIGPSGCGKTTILQLLAGLGHPDAGRITGIKGMRVSYVFQDPRLLLWKTVAQNIAFVLQDTVHPAKQQELIRKYLTMTGLYEYRDNFPKALSGGMKQRLALCRAFAYPHDLLLMDEPFKSLDTPLRLGLVRQVARMWQEKPRTVIFVTHEIMDALLLGHRIIVLSARPAAVLDDIRIDVPLAQRNVLQEPLPASHARLIALLEGENKKYFPDL